MQEKVIISFENINAGYGRTNILKDLSFEVFEGEVLGVIGPNGCGKTTMLNTLSGFIFPTAGSVHCLGKDITTMPPHKRCRLGIGRTWQIPRPFTGMTVYDNILAAALHGTQSEYSQIDKKIDTNLDYVARHTFPIWLVFPKKGEAHLGQGIFGQSASEEDIEAEVSSDIVLEILQEVGLIHRKDVMAGELTLLDRKRMELARALATKPRILLLDEVAAGLTEAENLEIMKLVASLRDRKHTIVWIEHNIETMLNSTDRLMCMAEGRNVICGKPEEVMDSSVVEELYLGADE